MNRGKNICRQLKAVRRRIAEENGIPLEIEDCSYKGECHGTCPRCEAEVRYLEESLASRLKLGKAATVAGIALALFGTAVAQSGISCPDIRQVTPSLDTVGHEMATLRGTVIDGKNQEPIPFCNITVNQDGRTVAHANTDFDGVFSLRLPVGTYDITSSAIGYTSHLRMGVKPKQDMAAETIVMELQASFTGEVEVITAGMPIGESDFPIGPDAPTQQMEVQGVKVVVR